MVQRSSVLPHNGWKLQDVCGLGDSRTGTSQTLSILKTSICSCDPHCWKISLPPFICTQTTKFWLPRTILSQRAALCSMNSCFLHSHTPSSSHISLTTLFLRFHETRPKIKTSNLLRLLNPTPSLSPPNFSPSSHLLHTTFFLYIYLVFIHYSYQFFTCTLQHIPNPHSLYAIVFLCIYPSSLYSVFPHFVVETNNLFMI
jgi:hypothetical protein